jgi:SAM-dependent methyltransferase
MVYPTSTLSQHVYLLRNNITNGGLVNLVRALPRAPSTFNCIIVLHVMNTLPPPHHRQTLMNLRRLLSPGGRLIVTVSARFTDISLILVEVNLLVQFRSTSYTEALSS